jgi:hypothetical protein
MLYLNGAVGQKDTDVELYILLLHYRRPPDPERIFLQYIPPQVNIKFLLKRGLKKKERPQEKRERPPRMDMIECTV